MKSALATLLTIVPGYRLRRYRLRAARNALVFLWQLDETYDKPEGVFWRLTRAVRGRKYRDDPYLMNFDLWLDNVELRAVTEHGGKFGTSVFHDFEFHRRTNTLCRLLYQQSVQMILLFKCEGPLPTAKSDDIVANIRTAIGMIRDLPQTPIHFARFQLLYGLALSKLALPENLATDHAEIEPERLCLLWLWVLTQVHSVIKRIVMNKFGLSAADVARFAA